MEKLKLEHVAPYLPYLLRINIYDKLGNLIFENNELNYLHLDSISQTKPILRPLSDLSKEEYYSQLSLSVWFPHSNSDAEIMITNRILTNTLRYTDYIVLIENHFDIFGLIDKGLAIDINTL